MELGLEVVGVVGAADVVPAGVVGPAAAAVAAHGGLTALPHHLPEADRLEVALQLLGLGADAAGLTAQRVAAHAHRVAGAGGLVAPVLLAPLRAAGLDRVHRPALRRREVVGLAPVAVVEAAEGAGGGGAGEGTGSHLAGLRVDVEKRESRSKQSGGESGLRQGGTVISEEM